MGDLRSKIIRLAHQKPEMRDDLLPLVTTKQAQEPELDINTYNTLLAKQMRRLKKDAGAKTIRQNYRGTGRQKMRRQLWIHFKNGAVIDVWLDKGFSSLGGVVTLLPDGRRISPSTGRIRYGNDTPEQVYAKIKDALLVWLDS